MKCNWHRAAQAPERLLPPDLGAVAQQADLMSGLGLRPAVLILLACGPAVATGAALQTRWTSLPDGRGLQTAVLPGNPSRGACGCQGASARAAHTSLLCRRAQVGAGSQSLAEQACASRL